MSALDTPTRPTLDIAERVRTSISFRDTVRQSFQLAWRGILKTRHNPEQLFDVVFTPILFTLMFTYIFGGAISGSVDAYLPVIIPGILVMTVITASVVTGTQLRDDMNKGIFDRFRALPISRISPLAGALLADVVRYAIASIITVLMGLVLGWRPHPGGIIAAVVLVMVCAFAISWIFALLGCLMKKTAGVQGVSMLFLFPLTFVSNAFVPVETMPGPLQTFVNINPISHLVTAVRELAGDGSVGMPVVWALEGAANIALIFAPLAVVTYMRTS